MAELLLYDAIMPESSVFGSNQLERTEVHTISREDEAERRRFEPWLIRIGP